MTTISPTRILIIWFTFLLLPKNVHPVSYHFNQPRERRNMNTVIPLYAANLIGPESQKDPGPNHNEVVFYVLRIAA